MYLPNLSSRYTIHQEKNLFPRHWLWNMFLLCWESRIFSCLPVTLFVILSLILYHFLHKYISQREYWPSHYFLLHISKKAQILLGDFCCFSCSWCFDRNHFGLKCWIHFQGFLLIYGRTLWHPFFLTKPQIKMFTTYALCFLTMSSN